MVGSHFNDSNLMIFVDRKDGERNANVVVQIPFSCKHFMRCTQYGCDQFFCGGFSVATG